MEAQTADGATVVDLTAYRTARDNARAGGGEDEAWVGYREVAECFGVSARTVERWTAAGCPYQAGGVDRFRLSEVRRWLESWEAAPAKRPADPWNGSWPELWVRYGDVAEYFAVSVRTVERWRTASCPCLDWGVTILFRLSEVDQWLDSRADAAGRNPGNSRRRPAGPSAEPWIRLPQVAEKFSVSQRTVERWVAAGCPHRPLGPRMVRFRASEITRWMWREGR